MAEGLRWKSEYTVHNELIDFQHRYLFELCNGLKSLQGNGENRLSIEQALGGLQDYVELHFREEEKLYRSRPDFTEHQKIHQTFIRETEQFAADFKEGKLELSELVTFISNWIVEHITKTDIRYFRDMEVKETG